MFARLARRSGLVEAAAAGGCRDLASPHAAVGGFATISERE